MATSVYWWATPAGERRLWRTERQDVSRYGTGIITAAGNDFQNNGQKREQTDSDFRQSPADATTIGTLTVRFTSAAGLPVTLPALELQTAHLRMRSSTGSGPLGSDGGGDRFQCF